jgi:hypothetical protein
VRGARFVDSTSVECAFATLGPITNMKAWECFENTHYTRLAIIRERVREIVEEKDRQRDKEIDRGRETDAPACNIRHYDKVRQSVTEQKQK